MKNPSKKIVTAVLSSAMFFSTLAPSASANPTVNQKKLAYTASEQSIVYISGYNIDQLKKMGIRENTQLFKTLQNDVVLTIYVNLLNNSEKAEEKVTPMFCTFNLSKASNIILFHHLNSPAPYTKKIQCIYECLRELMIANFSTDVPIVSAEEIGYISDQLLHFQIFYRFDLSKTYNPNKYLNFNDLLRGSFYELSKHVVFNSYDAIVPERDRTHEMALKIFRCFWKNLFSNSSVIDIVHDNLS